MNRGIFLEKISYVPIVMIYCTSNLSVYYDMKMSLVYKYRVSGGKLWKVIQFWEREGRIFLMFKIRFHLVQTWPFYDISSFFDLCMVLFHKLVFSKKNFFFIFFQKKFFFSIFRIINWCQKYIFIYTRLWSFII